MTMKKRIPLARLSCLVFLACPVAMAQAQPATATVQADALGLAIGPDLCGISFEDLNDDDGA